MTAKEAVIDIVKRHPCMTGNEIKNFVKREYGIDVTPQGAVASLRGLISSGEARKAKDANGKMVYWIITPEWKVTN